MNGFVPVSRSLWWVVATVKARSSHLIVTLCHINGMGHDTIAVCVRLRARPHTIVALLDEWMAVERLGNTGDETVLWNEIEEYRSTVMLSEYRQNNGF